MGNDNLSIKNESIPSFKFFCGYFKRRLETAKELFDTNTESGSETERLFEIAFINREIERIKTKYGIGQTSVSGEEKWSSFELLPIDMYLNWLKKNLDTLSDENAKIETADKTEKITKKQKFVYLKELGFFELQPFKESPQKGKEILLSKILGSNVDYARDLMKYNLHKYSKDAKNGIQDETIDKVKSEINKLTKGEK